LLFVSDDDAAANNGGKTLLDQLKDLPIYAVAGAGAKKRK
jgi:hypothetical protein